MESHVEKFELLKTFARVFHPKRILGFFIIKDKYKEIPHSIAVPLVKYVNKIQLLERHSISIEAINKNESSKTSNVYKLAIFVQVLNVARNLVYLFLPNHDLKMLMYFGDLSIYFVTNKE